MDGAVSHDGKKTVSLVLKFLMTEGDNVEIKKKKPSHI